MGLIYNIESFMEDEDINHNSKNGDGYQNIICSNSIVELVTSGDYYDSEPLKNNDVPKKTFECIVNVVDSNNVCSSTLKVAGTEVQQVIEWIQNDDVIQQDTSSNNMGETIEL